MLTCLVMKKLNSIVTELFIWGRKLNISFIFMTESCFKASKDVRLNTLHFSLWKFQIKDNLNKLRIIIYQISDYKDFMNLSKKGTGKPYYFFFIDTIFASDDRSGFRRIMTTDNMIIIRL